VVRLESLSDWWLDIGKRYNKELLTTRISENEESITLLLEYGNSNMMVARYDTTKGYGYVFDRRSEIRTRCDDES
jgi:hypothetical protein